MRDALDSSAAPDDEQERLRRAFLTRLDDAPVHLEQHAAPCGAQHHLDVRLAVAAPPGAVPVTSDESLDARWFGLDALPVQAGVDLPALVAASRPYA